MIIPPLILAIAAFLPTVTSQRELKPGDLPAAIFPPAGWRNIHWPYYSALGGKKWETIDVSQKGLKPNQKSLDATEAFNKILANTTGPRIFLFPEGSYYFKTTLKIEVSNVVLKGAGIKKTTLVIDAPGASNAQLEYRGKLDKWTSKVTGDVKSGASELNLVSADGVEKGDFIKLYKEVGRIANKHPLESQIFKVVAKEKNLVKLDMKVGLEFLQGSKPTVQKLNMLQGVGAERLKITRTNNPTAENVHNLYMHHVYKAFVNGIESEKGGGGHITIGESKNVVVENNFVHDLFVNKTGYGYGINIIYGSTRIRITNNKLWKLRHQISLSLGANHCIVSYNSLEDPTDYNDLALHATFAYMNLIEGNIFTEGYADNSKNSTLSATGPGNTWFRNHIKKQVGSINNDTSKQYVIGNYVVDKLVTAGKEHYLASNMVAGKAIWNSLKESSVIPASLYIWSKPVFLGTTPWPLFGPGVKDFGKDNSSPAKMRARP